MKPEDAVRKPKCNEIGTVREISLAPGNRLAIIGIVSRRSLVAGPWS